MEDLDPVARAAWALFREVFAREPRVLARAPGRVNLIGEHVDYQQGFCLPVAVPLHTVCCLARRPAGVATCRVVSTQDPAKVEEFAMGRNAHAEWARYVAGAAAQYGCDFAFDASFSTSVPLGGGLSSSAALEVSFACALEAAADDAAAAAERDRSTNKRTKKTWDPVSRALACVEGDHTFVGVPCGIMDQFASSCSVRGHALLIDCQSKTAEAVPFEDESVVLVVCNTNKKHSHSSGAYAVRVRECKEACADLGVGYLREVKAEADLDATMTERIKDPIVRKRARHVVSENARCVRAVEAARSKDWRTFGKLMNESHESLRTDFEVSCAELDVLVSAAQRDPKCFGARMTGGGFGGCMIALCEKAAATGLVQELKAEYARAFPALECTAFVFDAPAEGASVLALHNNTLE